MCFSRNVRFAGFNLESFPTTRKNPGARVSATSSPDYRFGNVCSLLGVNRTLLRSPFKNQIGRT